MKPFELKIEFSSQLYTHFSIQIDANIAFLKVKRLNKNSSTETGKTRGIEKREIRNNLNTGSEVGIERNFCTIYGMQACMKCKSLKQRQTKIPEKIRDQLPTPEHSHKSQEKAALS